MPGNLSVRDSYFGVHREAADFFKLLSHPIRFDILMTIQKEEFVDFQDLVDVNQVCKSTISGHLKILLDADLIFREFHNNSTRYFFTKNPRLEIFNTINEKFRNPPFIYPPPKDSSNKEEWRVYNEYLDKCNQNFKIFYDKWQKKTEYRFHNMTQNLLTTIVSILLFSKLFLTSVPLFSNPNRFVNTSKALKHLIYLEEKPVIYLGLADNIRHKKSPKEIPRDFSGETGIRTPGPLTVNGFQDRRIKPLCHLSKDQQKLDWTAKICLQVKVPSIRRKFFFEKGNFIVHQALLLRNLLILGKF
jgi:DNA-binding transcriptional ArsR family regulator